MVKFITIFFLSFFASLLYGADATIGSLQDTLWGYLASSNIGIKVIPVMIAIQVILYGLAEGLTRLSVFTENKWDNKVAMWLSQAAWVLGVLLGKFGYSTPKLLIEEKAKEQAAKESK